jgi:hypothetical protein
MATVVTITAAVRTSARAAALSVAVAGASGGETMTLWRRVGSAALVPVMGAGAIAAASRVIVDPEAPLNRAATWVVTTSTGASAESAALTVPSASVAGSALATIANPDVGVLADVGVVDRDTTSRANRVELVRVEGDPDPWVITDVPMSARRTVQVLALSPDAADRVWAVLGDGGPVLLRCGCGQHSDLWLQPVGDSVDSAPLVSTGGDLTVFALGECVVFAGNPDLTLEAAATTLGDVHSAVTPHTLGAIAARWATLGAIAAADLGV